MMSLTFGLFTQVSGSGPLGPLVSNSHSDLTLLFFVFFYFHNFEYQGSINVSVKFVTNYI